MFCPFCGCYIENGDPDEPIKCDCGKMFEVAIDIQDGRLLFQEYRETDELVPVSAQIIRGMTF